MQDMKSANPKFTPSIMPDVSFGIARPEQVIGLSGLEAIRAIPTGALPAPPMARTLQQWIEAADKGRAEFRGNPSKEYLNPMGLVHGGWTMALLDSAMGCAVQTILDAGEIYVSLGTEVKFQRPITAKTGQVRAIGTVIDRTRQTASAEARVEDSTGRILATGTSTCFLMPAQPARKV
ncbi:PaaI family thioesterase [Rhodobacteraceae bacterium D3-12]|nr:PaaI family thioesterase [Rhodobacteraceae bacterium D3-12]